MTEDTQKRIAEIRERVTKEQDERGTRSQAKPALARLQSEARQDIPWLLEQLDEATRLVDSYDIAATKARNELTRANVPDFELLPNQPICGRALQVPERIQLLAKKLAERDAEIARLKSMYDGKVKCPHCQETHYPEREIWYDGDTDEIDCGCGKSFTFSVETAFGFEADNVDD